MAETGQELHFKILTWTAFLQHLHFCIHPLNFFFVKALRQKLYGLCFIISFPTAKIQ